ncbi:MAG: PAS domain S-box protein, partial [Acidobacteria bacterium]
METMMGAPPLRILFVEDLVSDAELAAAELRRAGLAFESRRVETREQLIAALREYRPALVLSDYALPGFNGMEALALTLERAPGTPFILVTGSTNEETAVACMKAGAWDYVLKDRLSRLPLAVHGALDLARTRGMERAAREALERSEARQRAFFDASADGVFVKDAALRTVMANAAYAAMIGRSLTEVLGHDDLDLMPEAMARACRESDNEALRVGSAQVSEESAGGRVFETCKFPVPLPDGSMGVGGYVRDITERTRAEEALQASEVRYRRLFEAAKDGVLIVNAETGVIEDVNPFLTEMLGYSHEELVGVKLWEIGTFKDVVASREAFAELQRTGYNRHDNLPLETRDGRQVAVEFVSNAYDVDRVRVVQCNIRDITGRVRAEDALRASEERYRLVLANSLDAQLLTSPDGAILSANATACAMFGRSEAEILQAGRAGVIDATDPRLEPALAARLEQGSFRCELTGLRADGTKFPIEVSSSLFRDASGKLYTSMAIRDLTQRATLEAQLRQAQKMEAIGSLAGGVAHDFNNILQAMLSHAQLLRSQVSDPAKVAATAAELEQQIRRGVVLTRQLLLFSRRETTKPEALDLGDAVRASAQLLGRLVRENIRFRLELAEGPLAVRADRGQL